MSDHVFKAGDIVELDDGSIYILEERNGSGWKITTILETHQGEHHRGNPFPNIPNDWLDDAQLMGSMEVRHGEDV